jgi:uncharacterized membrane protein YqiK
MGRFHRVLDPGLAILVPLLDSIKYVQSLKEVAIEVPSQAAITQGTVSVNVCLITCDDADVWHQTM